MFGEGEIAVVLLCLSLHLVLSLPAVIVITCVSSVIEVDVLQVISQIVYERKSTAHDGHLIYLCSYPACHGRGDETGAAETHLGQAPCRSGR